MSCLKWDAIEGINAPLQKSKIIIALIASLRAHIRVSIEHLSFFMYMRIFRVPGNIFFVCHGGGDMVSAALLDDLHYSYAVVDAS